MGPRTVSLTAVLAALALGAAPLTAQPDPEPEAVTEHVIIVSIDGLRPDAVERFGAATLQRLMREGSYTLSARTVSPSITLPSHTSMLTGLAPERHGVTWNKNRMERHGLVEVPTIFDFATDAGLRTAAFFSKSKFKHLQREGSLAYSQAPAHNHEHWLATRTIPDAIGYLRHLQPNLLFVHLGEPDFAGHTAGWMGRIYGWAVRRADAALGELLRAADEEYGRGSYTVIVTSDHGGHGRSHGSEDPRDTTIPWITWGAGVEPGAIADSVWTMDTAATALWLLGIGIPPEWSGRPVASAYTASAQLVAAGATAADSAAAGTPP